MTDSDRLKQAIGLLIIANCPQCDGSGEVVMDITGTDAGCCGNTLPSGECCGNAIPVQVQQQGSFPCQWCYERDQIIKSESECKHGESLDGCCNACADSGNDPRRGRYIGLDRAKKDG